MLFKNLLVALLGAHAAAAAAAAAAASVDTVFTTFDDLHRNILSAQDCINGFDGGIQQGLYCGYYIYNTMMSTSAAKKALTDLDTIPADKVDAYLDRYHDIRASTKDSLDCMNQKTEKFDSAGLKIFAGLILQHFANERSSFEDLTKGRLAEENHTAIAGPVDSLGDEFGKALKKLI
ncbi:hypothetical protein BO71DRAFT_424604 [Aspergillus ellipticus CBS 707.79]|uniref:Cell wall protein n=1 Tax=Aspergillus ellipticus CBS 707.79 TaxID=1448320 RepID=A0A319EHA4_9EURO|nr:hypothetical protein BO71DRAFT_424604 [Aspergillus ellipticus CBS 707.79]